MPRFVLLRHDCPPQLAKPSHWDFMLEQAGLLATWQLDRLPADWQQTLNLADSPCGDSVPAIRLPDHRPAYLDYEGPISGDRGDVCRLDGGSFEVVQRSDDRLRVVLSGERLRGVVELMRDTAKPQAWRLRLG